MLWNEAKNHITIWSMKVDDKLLNEVPHVLSEEDEEVILFYLETISVFVVGHLLVTNQMLEDWEVTVEQVYEQAFENMMTEKFFTEDNKRCMWRYMGLELMKEKQNK